MPDVNISYKGSQIASMEGSGVKTLLTSGKYCEDDIFVSYNKIGNATAEGDSSVSVNDAESGNICSLIQYGVCEQDAQTNAISCNNGTLSVSSGEIVTTAANREAIALGSQTAIVENLYSVGNIRDEQELVTGLVTRKNAACIYDGTQPVEDRYISSTGAKDNGAIIIYPLETEHTGDSIVSFTETVKQDVNSLEARIEPIQDLHGYANPWPAGGGINKAKVTASSFGGSASTKDYEDNAVTIYNTSTSPGYKYNRVVVMSAKQYEGQTLAFTAKATVVKGTNTPRIICRLYESDQTTSVGSIFFELTGTSFSRSFTLPATIDEGVVLCLNLYSDSGQGGANEIRYYDIQIEAGSTAHDFSSYSNICPITGRTGVDAFVAPNASMWSKYKLYVDTGAASELMPVGGQITDTWNNTSGTSISFPWDIVHYTSNGDAFLKWHYAAPEALQFDAPEAIYYFDGTEPAGTYHIPIGSAYGTGWVAGHSIQFTLTAAPDEGDQLFIDCGTNYANDPADGRAWRVYDVGGTTVKQSGTTSEGTGGTSLGTIGNVNAHRTNGRLNAISRVVYGYARWSQSAMRQYFNSAEVSWWTMKNPWDRPPAQASTIRGFLCGFSQDFLNHLEETEVVTALNVQEGFAETTETTLDKIFLPSLEQMYINPQLAGVEGESWDYYKDLAAEAGLSGKFQTGQTYPILITYSAQNTSSAVSVFLRSCIRGAAYNEWSVLASGNVSTYGYAYYAFRGCPACKFKKSVPNGTRYNVDWTSAAGTVYGGTDEVVGGVLTDEWAEIPSYNGETITEPWLSSMDEYTPGATPTTGAQVVYKLATPITYQLTPQEIETLVGTNNVFSPDATSIKVVVSNPIIEYVVPQPLTLAEGSNTVSATNLSVSSVPLELNYISKAPVAQKDVNFIDYDGTVLYSYTASEFAALTALPANPSHSGLTAQGWNWTLADAKTHVAKYKQLVIGQNYVTSDGKTRVHIRLSSGRLSPKLGLCPNGSVDVDWGDGTAHSTVSGNSLTTVVNTEHAYASPGEYVITLTVTGSLAINGTSTAGSVLLWKNAGSSQENRTYQSAVKKVELGENVSLGIQAFAGCLSLSAVSIPNDMSFGSNVFLGCSALKALVMRSGISRIGNNMFRNCTSLQHISTPKSIAALGDSAFQNVPSLQSIPAFDGVANTGGYQFYGCFSLSSIEIPESVATIGVYAFLSCAGLGAIHFRNATPPTVSNSDTFTGIPTDCVIHVPYSADHSILNAYKAATNYPDPSIYTYTEEAV